MRACSRASWHACLQACKPASLQAFKLASLLAFKSASLQACKPASLQACKLASLQACKRASLQACKLAGLQACKLAGLQACKRARACKLKSNSWPCSTHAPHSCQCRMIGPYHPTKQPSSYTKKRPAFTDETTYEMFNKKSLTEIRFCSYIVLRADYGGELWC